MAATLAQAGTGRIVTIDLLSAKDNKPNVEELLTRVGERSRVEVFYGADILHLAFDATLATGPDAALRSVLSGWRP